MNYRTRNLEKNLERDYATLGGRKYRSKGEKRIAEFLEEQGISFDYEPPIFIKDDGGLLRIWYPDFKLGGEKVLLEYLGMKGDANYDEGVKKKKDVYRENGYKVITVSPEVFKTRNWKSKLLDIIKEGLEENAQGRREAA